MTYRVITLPTAEDDIIEAATQISQHANFDAAAAWITNLQKK